MTTQTAFGTSGRDHGRKGQQGVEKPNTKPNGRLYESMVDNVISPSIFVLSAGTDDHAYPDFLIEFITPIVKVTKAKKSLTFFTLPQYENWREETGNNAKGWKIKYMLSLIFPNSNPLLVKINTLL